MNLFDVLLFSSGTILGIYLDQIYELPRVKTIGYRIYNFFQQYEPKKKEGERN